MSYTFSRTEEEVTFLNPQDDWNQLLRVVTAADSPHRLLVSTTYQLPFFADGRICSGPSSADGS